METMEPEFETRKFVNYIIFVVLGAVVLKMIFSGGIFKSDWHKGDGYKIKFPAGWVLDTKHSTKEELFSTTQKAEQITYATQEINPATNKPAASMSMYTNKLAQAAWMADEFPGILAGMEAQGIKILQKGEIKIDKRIHKWVLYKNPYDGTLNFEFYFIDDSNYFYKLSLTTYPEYFDKYRPAFEASKETLKYLRLSFDQ